ncbi:GTP-binding protein [Olivibacter sp. CPCC 100613]|uniref:GTP-binding protein n=1 Tax=Olivibacter sp. CPCC 100613 TaxID=3079931 RepID=UPI002FFAA44F
MYLNLLSGFLGSGKTTAINHACKLLQKQGLRVGVITNDQGTELVDTQFMVGEGIDTKEVTGSCFCCNFESFSRNMNQLLEQHQVDLIFAESVGSCTDLVSTILNPLHRYYGEIRPSLSVFADAKLLPIALGHSRIFKDSVNYIYKRQLEEADLLIINKIDLLGSTELEVLQSLIQKEFPDKQVIYQNSLRHESILNWLHQAQNYEHYKERKSIFVDYDTYGAGEAALTWLDYSLELFSSDGRVGLAAALLIRMMNRMIRERHLPIGHLKFLIEDQGQRQKLSFTTMETEEPALQFPRSIDKLRMLINARVECRPKSLKNIIDKAIKRVTKQCNVKIDRLKTAVFIPGYPNPTHRIIT